MRAKTLLLTAALSVAGAAMAMAQTVYSVNAVGYVNLTVQPGQFALLANPLQAGTNTCPVVLPDAPNGTEVYKAKADGSGFMVNKKVLGAWRGPDSGITLNPGEGFYLKNGSAAAATYTFVGEVVQGTNVSVTVPAGFSMLGSAIPQEGKISTDLKMPAKNGDKLYIYNGSGFDIATYTLGAWRPSEPVVKVGQGFWYNAGATGSTWTRNFSVSQ